MTGKRSMLLWWLSLLLLTACSREMSLTQIQSGYSLISEDLKNQIKTVEKSIVAVTANLDYEIQTFYYELDDGKLVPDASSPVGYKLQRHVGSKGIVTSSEERAFSGGGLIIYHLPNTRMYTILTSSHLVSPKDTVDIYYTDQNGVSLNAIFQRRIIKKNYLLVRGNSNWRVDANLIAHNPIDDIAVITAETNRDLGVTYPNALGYELDLSWGDWVFLFGYPREIKQMTGGWVSESPYKGTFAIDAVVRYGFSGGPVFAIDSRTAELVFAGIVKSVPSSSFEYVAPDGSLPIGYSLDRADIGKLVVKHETVVHYGTAYCVHPKRIKSFLVARQKLFESQGVILSSKYYGDR